MDKKNSKNLKANNKTNGVNLNSNVEFAEEMGMNSSKKANNNNNKKNNCR